MFGLCPCEPIPSDVALEEVTPLGFSAEQVLALVGGVKVLEIDVEVTFSTADGAFNEHFVDKLVVDDPSRAYLARSIDLESLQGNLSLGLSDGVTVSESYLNVIVSDGFFAGDIAGTISSCDGSSCDAGSATFALWNDSGCRDRCRPLATVLPLESSVQVGVGPVDAFRTAPPGRRVDQR